MPFKSKQQERYMFKMHPEIAKEWVKKFGQPKNLPKYAKKKKRKK